MNLAEHYAKLYHETRPKLKAEQYELDPLIDSATDSRFGITLLLRPSDSVKKAIQGFLQQLHTIDPQQYYYPASDLHITVMAIISCYEGFALEQIVVEDYVTLVQKSLEGLQPFEINFKGLTASPSCILLQGFWKDNTLNQIRENLRQEFKSSSLQQSIDKRYTIQTAHSTIVRLRKPLQHKDQWLECVEAYRDFDFGTFRVNELELVCNDWYHRKEKVQTLQRFVLNK